MKKEKARARRKRSIRKKISGTGERPRMSIHKSLRNIYVQIIDDVEGRTLCGLSSRSQAVGGRVNTLTRKNVDVATMLGEEIAKIAVPKGIKKVVFDRSRYRYHGVVKAFADSARKNGLEF